MGCYDTFHSKDGKIEAQLKCFGCTMSGYTEGKEVPVMEHGLPYDCTIADWGGVSTKYFAINIMGEKERAGTFVVIEGGKIKYITENEFLVIEPVFDKYGYPILTGED